jgi:hypothetical protein
VVVVSSYTVSFSLVGASPLLGSKTFPEDPEDTNFS